MPAGLPFCRLSAGIKRAKEGELVNMSRDWTGRGSNNRMRVVLSSALTNIWCARGTTRGRKGQQHQAEAKTHLEQLEKHCCSSGNVTVNICRICEEDFLIREFPTANIAALKLLHQIWTTWNTSKISTNIFREESHNVNINWLAKRHKPCWEEQELCLTYSIFAFHRWASETLKMWNGRIIYYLPDRLM